MMAKRRARQFCAARPYKAGISLRRERSPEAPKMTMVQGSAGEMEDCLTGASTSRVALLFDMRPSLFRGRLDGVAAELVAHGGQQFVGIGIIIAGGQALEQGESDDRCGHVQI